MELYGRKIIYCDKDEINEGNIIDVLEDAMTVHNKNSTEINYLYDYYRGKQEILNRKKDIRPDICNKVVENRANEIVSFKVGYLCGEPVQYVSQIADSDKTEKIAKLNSYMLSESKANKDKELIECQMICGTAYRMVLPDGEDDIDEAPFEIYTLEPQQTFVIYSNKVGHKPLAGVYFTVDKNRVKTFSIYTKNTFFEIKDKKITRIEPYTLRTIPIIEYPANKSRIGAFEPVITMLDAINLVESNRLDGVEQFIQSLVVATNCQFEDGTTINDIRQAGMIILKSIGENKADFKVLCEQLDQTQTQTLMDNLYQTVLTITGMPNRNGGSSTSDTGSAVVYRDGWSAAEARAKDSELMFKESEQETLKLVLRICRDLTGEIDLRISDIAIKFTRRNFENIATKAAVLTQMLNSEKIAPHLAFLYCGLFQDAESAYKESLEYMNEQKQATQVEKIEADTNANTDDNTEIPNEV